jgi:hypothetical protein
MGKVKIYAYVASRYEAGDVVAVALCECGAAPVSHMSSSEHFAKLDMGYADNGGGIGASKHEAYRAHLGDLEYEIEWVDKTTNHEGVQDALKKNLETRGKGVGHDSES